MLAVVVNAIRNYEKENMMKLKGDALKLAVVLLLTISFIIYANIVQNRQKAEFNQFINGEQGKTLVIQYLFQIEGIDKAIIEQHMKSKSLSVLNRDLDNDYKIDNLIKYALQELNLSENEIAQLTHLIADSKQVTIPDVFREEYSTTTNAEEKVALIKVLIKNDSEIWNK